MQLFKHVTANNIVLKEFPFFREISMEAYLIENADILILDNDELSELNIIDVELTIIGGRKSKQTDGRIDLIVQYGQETIGVIELKLGKLNENHLVQLEDYLQEIEQISKIIVNNLEIENPKYIGILIGNEIDSKLSEKINNGYLINGLIPVAALTIKRYRGEDNNIYVLTDTYFKNLSRNFDKTQYLFNGNVYGKGRLVLALVKKYVEDNPDITYANLEKIFPKKLEGSRGVFDSLEKAKEIYNRSNRKRHFIKPEEIIMLKDTKIVVSTQWGIRNINNILKKAKELKYKVDVNNE